VTIYLLDENVLRELGPNGNVNVRRWLATVDDTSLRLSAATLFEKRRGAQILTRRDPKRAAMLLAGIDSLEKTSETALSQLAKKRSPSGLACSVEKARIDGTWPWRPQLAFMGLFW
jgi:predicted nucleic acid-binding protein